MEVVVMVEILHECTKLGRGRKLVGVMQSASDRHWLVAKLW